MLRTEQNTPARADEIQEAAQSTLHDLGHEKNRLTVAFEHGQHWITCLDCGAQWSVVDSTDLSGYSFEQVTEGDEESCTVDACSDCGTTEGVESSYCGSFCSECRAKHDKDCGVCREDSETAL